MLVAGGCDLLADGLGSNVDPGQADVKRNNRSCVSARKWISRCIAKEGSKGSWMGRRNSGHFFSYGWSAKQRSINYSLDEIGLLISNPRLGKQVS